MSRHRWLLVLFCATLWLPSLPARTLWPTDEPRYALIARDMLESGDWIVPRKAGAVYSSQPPLFLWAETLCGLAAGGMSAAAARVPSFLAALAGVLLTHGLASRLFGPSVGLLSGLVLATSVRYSIQAQWASTDMILCAAVTACLAFFQAGYSRRDTRWYLVMHAMAALGAMTKGPVGIVLPWLVILAYLATRRDLAELLRMRLPVGALIATSLIAPWLLLYGSRAGWAAAADLVLRQSFHRYVDAWNNLQPWYYYTWRCPLDLLPWAPAVIMALAASARGMDRPSRDLLWCWMGTVLLFYSLTTGKRGVYIMPIAPAAAILTGWYWDRALAGAARGLRIPTAAIALLFGAAGAFLASPLLHSRGLPAEARPIALILAALCMTAAAAIALVPARASFGVVCAAVAALNLAALLAVPIVNRRQNTEGFGAVIAHHVPEGSRLGIVRDGWEDLVYYGHRDAQAVLRPGESLDRWLRQTPPSYAVLDSEAWEDLERHPGVEWGLLATDQLSGKAYYLIVTR